MYMNHKYIAWPFAFVTPLLFRLATPTDPALATYRFPTYE